MRMSMVLRTKLGLAMTLPMLLVVLITLLLVPTQLKGAAHELVAAATVNHVRVVTRLLSARPAGEVSSEELEGLLAHEDVRYVALLDSTGELIASREAFPGALIDAPLEPVTQQKEVLAGETLVVLAPIPTAQTGQNEAATTLALGFGRQRVEDFFTSRQMLLIIVGTVLVLLFRVLAWAVSRRLERPLREATSSLSGVSGELISAARSREASAAEQAAAVEETRRTMDMLLNSAQKIADSASLVLGNAERSLDGNRVISQRIEDLNRHAEKVAEILATIMQVADRTDLLALNAALEGTKAGEAGKGFTLVAKEMRRLAENVMESVAGIRRLMGDVRTASLQAVEASTAGTSFSEETTRSVREIALVTQQQRRATEQVTRSMDEMTELLNHALAEIKDASRSALLIGELSDGLTKAVGVDRAS